jgi:hypothetical protein
VTRSQANDGHEDFIMSIQSNTFCWQGISTDVATGTPFYSQVMGWDVADSEAGAVFVGPGGAVAHIQPLMDGTPAHWCTYLAVDDLDASTAAAGEQGAILVPPTALPAGRFSLVVTPSGAAFALYEADAADEQAKPGPGSLHWVELHSTSVDTDLAWFQEVFGIGHAVQQMPSGPYTVLQAGGANRGGVVPARTDRAVFFPWVQVADVAATVAAVRAHDGAVITDVFEEAIGRMAVVADPSGAVFGVIQPA